MSLLVVQGPQIPPSAAADLAALTGGIAIRARRPGVIQIRPVQRREGIADYCRQHRLDFAFLESPRPLSSFRLLAMDMDSTLITIECIDEIADFAGLKPQVAAITAAAMRGELDFPASLRQRVALLAGLSESVLPRVFAERLQLSPGAEKLLAGARAAGLKTLLVSGGFTYFTERLAAQLGLDFTLANTLEIESGRFTGRVVEDIVDGSAKAAKVSAVCAGLGCSTHDAVVLGDGANDLPMMVRAGFSVAFRAKPVVQQQASAALNFCGLDGVLNWLDSTD